MKNLKTILLICALAVSTSAYAGGYSRIGVSYNNTSYNENKYGDSDDNFKTNGFGIDYIKGFNITPGIPLFLEAGINANFNFHSESESDFGFKTEASFQNINFQVPVNFGYRFHVMPQFSIAPYVGINFKLNVISRLKAEASYDGESAESEWFSCYSADDMGDSESTWNRFQMGWHVGVGFQFTPFYLGFQYGTDFIPTYSYDLGDGTYRINNGNLKITAAFVF
jgi:hypothetical protein